MSEVETFRDEVERFMRERCMTPTQFGRSFAGDPQFVFQLRDGREPRSATRQKIRDRMSVASQEAAE